MGWGAAMAIAEEWSEWCSGPEEAYEILYGNRERKHHAANRCPVCGNKFASPAAVLQHADAKHKRPKHQAAISEYREQH